MNRNKLESGLINQWEKILEMDEPDREMEVLDFINKTHDYNKRINLNTDLYNMSVRFYVDHYVGKGG